MTKKKVKNKQRRGIGHPLNPGLSPEEAAAILAHREQHSALQVVHAMAALGHCVLYGSLQDPLIKLSSAIKDLQPSASGETG